MASAWEKISWQSRSLDAGKVDIATQFYSYKTVLGKANFSPELAFPLEAVYDSGSDQTGMLGYRWKAVQLESRVFPRENGAEWVTPWGEKIAFYTKEKPTAEMLEVFRDQMKGRGCFSPYADWQALGAKGNWVIAGTKKYQGWSFVYSNSQLAKVTAPTGRSLSFNYVGDKLVSVEQNGVKFIELNYGKNRQLAGITINGVKVSFDFTAVNTLRLPEKVDQKAATLRRSELASIARGTLTPVELGYDKSGYLSSIKMGTVTELLDVEHESSYDRLSYLKAVENAAKEKMHTSEIEKLRTKVDGRLLADRNFTYSYPDKNTVDVKNKQGQTAKYSYNGDTGILNIVNFAGLSQTVYYFRRYDVAYNGNLRQIKDAKGRIVANYRYDHKSGNLVRVRDMMDNEIHYSYDKQNRLELVSRMEESATNPMRPLVRFGYDAQGNPDSVSMLAPDGKAVNTVKYFYDKNRNVTKIDSGANFTRFNYTPFGLPDRISDTFDRTQKLKYDTYNRVVEATNFYGVRTTYSYDKNGLLSEIIRYAPGKEKQAVASVTLTRNPAGEIISMTDHANLTKKFDRSAEGRIIAEYFPNQTSVHYQYTDLGQISNVQDANRNPINFAYSKFGSVASTVTAAGQKTSYDYDQYGLLTGVKSGFEKSHKADRNVKYTYDQYDRLTKADYGNGFSQEYSYDRFGKILQTKAVSPANTKTVTMTYDDFDRVIRKTEDVTGSDKPQLTIYEFVYNPDGRRKSVDVSFQDGTAHRSTYSYDKYGRLTRLSQNDKTVQYEYDKFSRVSRQIVNGTPITFMYTATGQLESKAVGTDIRPLGVLKYTYSPDGQIASREVNGRVDKFGYNALGQLVTVKDGASG
ncbi:MAG TPA: hypothetical protein PKK48_07215, partial [Phycisphaerae bacterium]|nr:hypothetical protein [Phycisphaerae bacterium]